MITTVTLNTSVDKLYLVEKLEDYTVMRVKKVKQHRRRQGVERFQGSVSAGEKVSALGFAGGFNGSYVSSLLEAQGVRPGSLGFRRRPVPASTSGAFHREAYGILEPGAPVAEDECGEFLAGYREALPNSQVVTISGSVPAGVEIGFYGKLVSMAKQAGDSGNCRYQRRAAGGNRKGKAHDD